MKLWLPVMNGKKVDLFRIWVDMDDRRTVLFVLSPNYIIVIQHCFTIYDACNLFLLSLSTIEELQDLAVRRYIIKTSQM